MKHRHFFRIALTLVLSSLPAATTLSAQEKPHWGYTGEEGPEHWAELSPEFAKCGDGQRQTPIDLTGFTDVDLPAISFNYSKPATDAINNGHTVQVNFPAGNSIQVGDRTFELKQVHFHTPSENWINGKSFPMEAHLVHMAADGSLGVIGVMFVEKGSANSTIGKVWAKMPEKAGEEVKLSESVLPSEFLPGNRDYYQFEGSLTTPPCSEGVHWMVMKNPVGISKSQVEAFAQVLHHPNNRPIQERNGRKVLE